MSNTYSKIKAKRIIVKNMFIDNVRSYFIKGLRYHVLILVYGIQEFIGSQLWCQCVGIDGMPRYTNF